MAFTQYGLVFDAFEGMAHGQPFTLKQHVLLLMLLIACKYKMGQFMQQKELLGLYYILKHVWPPTYMCATWECD